MLRIVLLITYNISIIFMMIALGYKNTNYALLGTSFLIISNLIYGFRNIKNRVLFILFNLSMFTFLLGENLIKYISGEMWMQEFSSNIIFHCFILIFTALLSLVIGNFVYEHILSNIYMTSKKFFNRDYNIKSIRKISFIIFIFSGLCQMIVVLNRASVVANVGYVESYTTISTVPIIISKIGQFFTYSFFIYLSTLPDKKTSTRVILLYSIYLIATLATGVRGIFIYNSFAIVFYYVVRHYTDKNECWITGFVKTIILVGTPMILVFLVIVSNIRIGIEGQVNNSFVDLLIEFFKQQGGSINTIAYGKIHEVYITNLNQNYTFGPIINLFNSIFNGISFNNNTIDMAIHGNSFGSTISYIMMPEAYVSGAGLGSSYLAEIYSDFGYLGVIGFNLFLGMILSWINTKATQNWWTMAIGLMCIVGLESMPRSEALSWLRSIIGISGIGLVIGVYILSEITRKVGVSSKIVYKK